MILGPQVCDHFVLRVAVSCGHVVRALRLPPSSAVRTNVLYAMFSCLNGDDKRVLTQVSLRLFGLMLYART